MSLLKTLKKRYDTHYTRFGECFLGPRASVPIPPHSLIMCGGCGEYIAFTREEFSRERIDRFTGSLLAIKYREQIVPISSKIVYTPIMLRHDSLGWLCPFCGANPHLGDDLLYLPVGPMCLVMALNNWSENGKK